MLAEQAAKAGVEIRRGTRVTGLRQDAEGVLVQAGKDEYAARWLVGCDGGRSTVRGLAGFEFTGTEPLFTGYTMLATVADPDKLQPGFTPTPTGMYLQMPTPGHIGMLDCDGGAFDRSQQPTLEHLQTVLRRVSGTDVTLSDVQLVSTGRCRPPPTAKGASCWPETLHTSTRLSAHRGSTPASVMQSTWDGSSPRPSMDTPPTTCSTPTRRSAIRSAPRSSTGRAPRARS